MTTKSSPRNRSMMFALTLAGLAFAAGTAATAQKPGLHGLVAMGPLNFNTVRVTVTDYSVPDNTMEEPNAHPEAYNAAVIAVTWQELQPADSAHITFTAIDNAIAAIKAYNAVPGRTRMLKAKLRVFSGVNAPTWVLGMTTHYNGTAYTGAASVRTDDKNTSDPSDDVYGDVPQFWTSEYHTYWQNLQNLLAAKYDSFGGDNALIQEVAVSSCSSLSAEPFILPIHNPTSLSNVKALGYNDTQVQACFAHAVANDATGDYFAWKNTPLYLPFAAFSQSDAPPVSNLYDVTPVLMNTFRANFGVRAVIGNNALQNPIPANLTEVFDGKNGYGQGPGHSNDTTYPGIQDLGPRIGFQSVGPAKIPDTLCGGDDVCAWNDLVENMANAKYNATEMEIFFTHDAYVYAGKPNGAGSPVSQAMLNNWATNYNWF